MKLIQTLAVFGLAFAASAAAQPVIATGGIVNSASYSHQGLPNSGIAQGSLFIIFGSGMGPAALQRISAFPLPTTLPSGTGTSVAITAGGQTFAALMIYTSANQVAAILPSAVPVGAATMTVTYNGQTSAPANFNVVSNSFGVFAVNQAGSGPGVFTDASYKAASLTASSEPGETWIIWGTGIGAVSGDEAAGPLPGDMKNLQVQVYVGSQQAEVVYRGRSGCCSGVDQIAFKVPSGILGCNVPVAVQVGGVVSNFVTLPIASGGRVCSDPSGFTTDELTALAGKGNVSIGVISLSRVTSSFTLPPPLGNGTPTTSTSDSGFADFTKYQFQQFNNAQNPFKINTYGTCSVFTFTGSSGTETDPTVPIGLNAGNAISVTGPNGNKQLTPLAGVLGSYSAALGGGTPGLPGSTPLYLDQGSYAINNGAGGPDVGGFSLNLTVPQPLVWTNEDSISTISRSQGLPITWTGSDPSGLVFITGVSIAGTTNASFGAGFVCTAKGSDNQFTVPPVILLSLPASGSGGSDAFSIPLGFLSVGSYSNPQSFTAPGLDKGIATSSVITEKSVTYQ